MTPSKVDLRCYSPADFPEVRFCLKTYSSTTEKINLICPLCSRSVDWIGEYSRV
jgi:hypothetical protein